MKYIRFLAAFFLCLIALFLPYRPRVAYMQALAAIVHLPFRIFGALARKLLAELGEANPYER